MTPINKEAEGIVVKDTIAGNETEGRDPTKSTTAAEPETFDVEGLTFGKMKFLETQVSALSCEVPNSSFNEPSSSTTPKEIMKEDIFTVESPLTGNRGGGINYDEKKQVDNANDDVDNAKKEQVTLQNQPSSSLVGDTNASIKTSITYRAQPDLPPLPIPSLDETLNKFLNNLEALHQTDEERAEAQGVVLNFMKGDGPKLQKMLLEYDRTKRAKGEIGSYVEEFWNDSYLAPDSSVVLNLNPFFVLEGSPDPKLSQDPIRRAAMLCFASIKLASQLRHENLQPDMIRGKALCMDQFKALFAATRVPMQNSKDAVKIFENSNHVAVMCASQIYYFQALWPENGDVAVDEGDLFDILESIHTHAHEKDPVEASQSAIGLLTSLGRREWAIARDEIYQNPRNKRGLDLIDSALFVLVLDDYKPQTKSDKAANMLHGCYELRKSEYGIDYQAGSCCNRWYDKLQIIVCGDATAGINFEHSAIDGHTALRFVSDIYAETVIKFARSITKIVHGYDAIPHIIQAKVRRAMMANNLDESGRPSLDIFPKKITFDLSESVKRKIFFAETALGDQIVVSETHVLEFKDYGKKFITTNKLSPDSFVQMSMMLAYYMLYGRIVCTYEPVLTKTFYHGRTEAMRSATMEAKQFCEIFCDSKATPEAKLSALRNATKIHSQLVKECARGKGVDRHLFALRCIAERNGMETPAFFNSAPWKLLNHTVLSTSNCGNPSLAQFGFGPVVSDGFGIGYIIKDSSIYYSISSKHRQTVRYASTLESVLEEMATLVKSAHHRNTSSNITQSSLHKRTNSSGAPKPSEQQHSAAFIRGYVQNDSYGDIWGESTPKPSPRITKKLIEEELHQHQSPGRHVQPTSPPQMMMMPDLRLNALGANGGGVPSPPPLASRRSSTFTALISNVSNKGKDRTVLSSFVPPVDNSSTSTEDEDAVPMTFANHNFDASLSERGVKEVLDNTNGYAWPV